ncbi:iron-containing alcohol dehydrogenase [Amedibacterium intestinale]|uniref:iron-containing alcohol dehydrogenase n=1 Tax=Amedibacterium intestinale TaxID=2583452 RepID=UPI000E4F4F98|nr:iron-containing alcohol dehydrogenase [Amedibacterium intestinale]RHO26485.1 iron-containing alcohol dehydrogenase [Erysipelotrichaceae bacterium AM17-60]
MNLIKKVYCRTYQSVFRCALPLLPYRKPKILNDYEACISLLKEKNISSLLLVSDESIRSLQLTKSLENHLKQNDIQCIIYDKTVANPTSDNVEEARELYIKNSCQAIIGFGGGSCIDCAKAVGARIARPKKSLDKMEGILKVLRKLPLLIAIPTTAGTGSETTLAAVITDGKTRHKYPMNDFSLIPHYAVLDPMVTLSLPAHISATTGMDALTHAIEAYIGRSTTKETRKDALEAVKLIFSNLPKVVENGNDIEARKHMLHASFLAGSAFTKSYVGYVHAVAHSLGGKYNIAHGLANAILLPNVLEVYGKSAYKKLHKLSCTAGLSNDMEDEKTSALKFIQAIKDMQKKFHIPNTIPQIKKEDIEELAAYADKEANPLYPVPKLMDAKQLEKFYIQVMEENK